MRYADIPLMTSWGSYRVDVQWSQLEQWLVWLDRTVRLEIEPDFQRVHVWDESRQRAYVEYRLHGGTGSETIFWNSPGWNASISPGPVQLVDGLQRLTAVRRFMAGELRVFRSVGWDLSPRGDGYTVTDIDGSMRFHLTRFSMVINDLPDRASVLRWYLELNAGGVAHTPEEIARVRALLEAELAS